MWWYNLGISLYTGIIKTASLFKKKARLWTAGRRNIFDRLATAISKDDKIVWVHSASLGEFEQGRPVIEAIRRKYPEYKILLTFFSPSGYEIRKNYDGADYIFYLPTDSPKHARRFLDIVNPEVAIFVKYEFWLNYLTELGRRNCRTFIVSAIFRPDAVFFRPYGGAFRKVLRNFEHIFVQNNESKERLAAIGFNNVTVAGDTRFDRVAEIAGNARTLPIVARFAEGHKVFIAGSTWAPDEDILQELINANPTVKFIIAPHEMDNTRINALISNSAGGAARYTCCDEKTEFSDTQVLIIDTIGILSSAYRYAAYSYIGGGFGVGIHNTLEAATFGLPIAFGPKYQKFQEAKDLISVGAAKSIQSYEELAEWFTALRSDSKLYDDKHKSAFNYIKTHIGATDIIVEYIFSRQRQ